MGRDRPWEKEKSIKLKGTIEIIKRIKETIKGHKNMGAPGIKGDKEALQHAIDILERVNEEGIAGAIPMSFTKGPFGEECKVAYFQGTAEIGGTVRKRDIALSILDYLRGKDGAMQ